MSTFVVTIYNHETGSTVHRFAVSGATDHFDVEVALGGQYRNGGKLELRVEELNTLSLADIRMIRG